MLSNDKKLIAVTGATGQQGGGVVRALQAGGRFRVRALTRNLDKYHECADEVVKADLDRPETLPAALKARMASFWSPIFEKQVPARSSRQPRRYALPRMPASNTLSGPRCLM